jgi:acyl-CoA thioesterase-1
MNPITRKPLVVLMTAAGLLPSSGQASARVILALGDSLTEGYILSPKQAYPALLEEALRREGHPDVRVINAGINGSTTDSGLERLERYLNPPPEVLLLALGVNDGLRHYPLDRIRGHLSDMIERAQSQHVKVILAGMKLPLFYPAGYRAGFEAVYSNLAAKYQVPLIPFLLEGVAGIPELNLSDTFHPNARGHVLMAQTVRPYVLPLLSKTPNLPSK